VFNTITIVVYFVVLPLPTQKGGSFTMLPNPHEPPVTKKYNFLSQSNVKGTVKNYTSLNFAYNANGMGLPSLPAPCRLPYHVAVAGCQPSPTAACEHSIMHVASAIAKKLKETAIFEASQVENIEAYTVCQNTKNLYVYL
jgi:hypothetical protein